MTRPRGSVAFSVRGIGARDWVGWEIIERRWRERILRWKSLKFLLFYPEFDRSIFVD